jgi:hypothetical protein
MIATTAGPSSCSCCSAMCNGTRSRHLLDVVAQCLCQQYCPTYDSLLALDRTARPPLDGVQPTKTIAVVAAWSDGAAALPRLAQHLLQRVRDVPLSSETGTAGRPGGPARCSLRSPALGGARGGWLHGVAVQPELLAHAVAGVGHEERFHARLAQVGAGEAQHVGGAVDGGVEEVVPALTKAVLDALQSP